MRMSRKAAFTFFFMILMTFVSKLMGLARESVMAGFYGAGYIVDSYVMAVAIPTILFGGLFSAVATAYMPVFSTVRETEGQGPANVFTSQILNILLLISAGVALTGILLARPMVSILAAGFSAEAAALTTFFLRITFGYVIFASLASVFDAYLQYRGAYLRPIVAGYFYNAAIILAIVVSAFFSHRLLVAGVVLGALLRLCFIALSARGQGFFYTPNFALNEPVRRILHLAVPVFIGSYILQINSFVDKALASRLPEGSVSALNYGMLLITLITGLTVSLLVTLIYPKLARANTHENAPLFNAMVEKGVSLTGIITIPFTFGILLFGRQAVQVVYERGAFDSEATAMTAGAFFFYGIGLCFFSLNELLTKIFYSMENARAPIVCSGISVIINIGLNLMLVQVMEHRGLALATSAAAMANTVLLLLWMKKRYPHITPIRSGRKLAKIVIASLAAVAAAYLLNLLLTEAFQLPGLLSLLLSVGVAGIVYLPLLLLMGVEEVREGWRMLKTKRSA